MHKFRAILYDTMLEIMHRKMLYVFAIVTVLITLVFLAMPGLSVNGESILDSDPTSQEFAKTLVAQFLSQYIGFVLFFLVFGAAGMLPSYLNRGRVELNLSKPISRTGLLLMKFAAVYLIMVALMALMCLPLWLALSIRLEGIIWSFLPGFLIACIDFAIIYSIVFLLGLISSSTAVAIIGYFALSVATGLLSKREVIYQLLGETWQKILNTVYHILPKMNQVEENITSLMQSNGLDNIYAIWSSLVFAVVMMLLAIYFFRKKDY